MLDDYWSRKPKLLLKALLLAVSHSALDRATRTSLINPILATSEFIGVFDTHAINTATSVKLVTHCLVSLNHALKLAGQIGVLTCEASGMLLESFSLTSQVGILTLVLRQCHSEGLDVTSKHPNVGLLIVEADLVVADLDGESGIAAFASLYLLPEVVVLGSDTVIVTPQGGIFTAKLVVLTSSSGEASLSVR